MKGSIKLIEALNSLLADELTASNQYTVHSEVNSVKGYKKLHHSIKARYKEELNHVEDLIERIIFLGGKPVVADLNPIRVAFDLPTQLANDADLEMVSIENYNKAIIIAQEVEDASTEEFLEEILDDEIDHLKKIEGYLTQIDEMGLENFLSTIT